MCVRCLRVYVSTDGLISHPCGIFKYPMLITVYQWIEKKWEVVHQYYWFKTSTMDENQMVEMETRTRHPLKPRYKCPGCDETFTEVSIRSHRCIGGNKGFPKLCLVNRRLKKQSAKSLDKKRKTLYNTV